MFDLILRGDGCWTAPATPTFSADVAVEDGRIAAVGQLGAAEAREVVDVAGLTVCPGFIDVHCHSDALPFAADPLPAKILQGVTTEVNGNCGSHRLPARARPRATCSGSTRPATFADAAVGLDAAGRVTSTRLEQAGPVSNIAPLVGHGAIRVAAFGFENRPPTDDELRADAAAPGRVAGGRRRRPLLRADLLARLLLGDARAGRAGRGAARLRPAVLLTHPRGETAQPVQGPSTRRSRSASGPACRSSTRTSRRPARPNYGRAGELLAAARRARERGVEVTGDVYPYDAGSGCDGRAAAALVARGRARRCCWSGWPIPAERERIEPRLRRTASPAGRTWPRRRAGTTSGSPASRTNPSYLGKRSSRSPTRRGSEPVEALCDADSRGAGPPDDRRAMMDEPDVRRSWPTRW